MLEDVESSIYENNKIEIKGSKICIYNHRSGRLTPDKAIELGLIYNCKDVYTASILKKRFMRRKVYEKEARMDYNLITNCKWTLESFSGEKLSSENSA